MKPPVALRRSPRQSELLVRVYKHSIHHRERSKYMLDMQFANNITRDKHIRKLVLALKAAGLEVTITKGKQHVRVENKQTHKVVFFGGNSLGDWRAAKNILRDLKQVGFDQDIKLG